MDWCEYRLVFTTDKEWNRPKFAGSMIRGAFGYALKKLVCVMRQRACDDCPLEYNCIYTTIFETRPNTNAKLMKKYTRVPHPFVIDLPAGVSNEQSDEGNNLLVDFRMFGESCSHATFCIRAFEEAAIRGFTKARIPFALTSIYVKTAKSAEAYAGGSYPEPVLLPSPNPLFGKVRMALQTPVRIKYNGKLMTPESFDIQAFLMAAVRRYGLIQSFYGQSGYKKTDFAMLKKMTEKVVMDGCDLHWESLYRMSSRQKKTQSISGLTGSIDIDITQAEEIGRILAWIPILHIGKGTSMGLGKVSVIT